MTGTQLDAVVRFRAELPALKKLAWFDSLGSPPGARCVTDAMEQALRSWADGSFSWHAWDDTPNRARSLLSSLVGVPESCIALMGSVSEAAATIANSMPHGARVVVGDDEFRSTLLPWLQLSAISPGRIELKIVEDGPAEYRTQRIIDAIEPGTNLVALSSVLPTTGARVDISKIAARAHEVGARLFVDATQSFGVVKLDMLAEGVDYLAVHAYKWMLAPRGCAWLAIRPGLCDELQPIAPGWHSVEEPRGGYVGIAPLAGDAHRLDGGLAWLPWIGGEAAFDLLIRHAVPGLEAHVLQLSAWMRQGLSDLGLSLAPTDLPSHVVRAYSPSAPEIVVALRSRGVILDGSADSFRMGIHAFNTEDDVGRLLEGLKAVIS